MRERFKPLESRFLRITLVIAVVLVVGTILTAILWSKHRQDVWGVGTVIVTILLASITAVYVWIMRELLESERQRDLLSFSPFIGLKVSEIDLQDKYIRVKVALCNGGNAPAIDVFADAELDLKIVRIQGEKAVPAFFPAIHIPFLMDTDGELPIEFYFGATAIDALTQDVAKCQTEQGRRGVSRKPPVGIWDMMEETVLRPKIRVSVCYRNHLKQYFSSDYAATITMSNIDPAGLSVPEPEELKDPCNLFVRPSISVWDNPPLFVEDFNSGPTDEKEIARQLKARNRSRELGGICLPCLDVVAPMWERAHYE